MGKCIEELNIDLKDYVEKGTVFKRKAVRGIIKNCDRYLVIHGKYGDYKFPGGGMKDGESLQDTLIREVQEETGYQVVMDSITDYFLVHEKRKGNPSDLLIMDSWYYLCDVEKKVYERNLDEYEKEYAYQAMWVTLEGMIRENDAVGYCDKIPWIVRDTMVMRRLAAWESYR